MSLLDFMVLLSVAASLSGALLAADVYGAGWLRQLTASAMGLGFGVASVFGVRMALARLRRRWEVAGFPHNNPGWRLPFVYGGVALWLPTINVITYKCTGILLRVILP